MTLVNPTIISDQAVRDRIRDDLDVTLVIEAAAGTGKTTALVNRIVSVIGSGRGELARIVAVTFTEKAAGELKLRLRAEIERARQGTEPSSEGRARFDLALKQLEEARIGTIHSFCADLLRERPVEARVDPMFEVAPEDVAGEMFDAAFERWFERILDQPGEGMRRLLRRRDCRRARVPRDRKACGAGADELARFRFALAAFAVRARRGNRRDNHGGRSARQTWRTRRGRRLVGEEPQGYCAARGRVDAAGAGARARL